MDSQGLSGDSIATQCERRLSDCGIRPTGQRVRIASLLLSAPQHLSAEQILESLRGTGARVSKATVYNTLNLFAERGLIRQLSVDGSRAWFDSNVDAHYHFHDMTTRRPHRRPDPRRGIQPPAPAAPRHRSGRHRHRHPPAPKKLIASPAKPHIRELRGDGAGRNL